MQALDQMRREELVALVHELQARLASPTSATVPGGDLDYVTLQALTVLDNSGIAALVFDTTGSLPILAANLCLCTLAGCMRGELDRLPVTDLLVAEDRERLRRMLRLPRQGGFASAGGWHLSSRSGELREIEVSGYDLDFRGCRARFVIVQDVTQRRREQLVHQRLAAIVETSHDAILSHTVDGIVLSWNRAAQRLFGYGAAELVGRSVEALLPEDIRNQERELVRGRIAAGLAIENHHTQRQHKDGTRVEVAVSVSPLRDTEGRIVGAASIIRDMRVTTLQRATAVTERKDAEAARALLAAVADSSQDAIISHDMDGTILSWNRGAEEIFGYRPEEVIGRDYRLLTPSNTPEQTRALAQRLLDGERMAPFESVSRHRDGREIPVSVSLAALRNESGRVVGVTAVARDITEPRRAAQALRESEQQLESILNNAAEALIVVSADGSIERFNLAAQRLFGYGAEEAHGLNLRKLTVELAFGEEAGADAGPAAWIQSLVGGRREVTGRRSDGSIFPLELALSEIDMAPHAPRFTAVVRDITERKSWENRIYTLAYTDSLTGLPNRLLLRDRLEHAIAAAQRNRTLVGVLFFDLDHFKAINDSYGHHMGDALLREIAARTTGCVREIDTVCRLGGDEFVLVLPELRDAADAGAVARKVLAALSQPYRIDGLELAITPTLGISIYPKDGTDADSLLRNADTAMYHAKESGKNAFRFYGMT